MSKYCPNCVTEMQKEKRKLGSVKNWYKCPSCGVREEVVDISLEVQREEIQRKKLQQRNERDNYIAGCDPY